MLCLETIGDFCIILCVSTVLSSRPFVSTLWFDGRGNDFPYGLGKWAGQQVAASMQSSQGNTGSGSFGQRDSL